MYTSHHDPTHCFPESKEFNVITVGDRYLPRHILGRFHVACAMLRSIVLAVYVYLFCPKTYDVFIVDQVSVAVPIFKLCARKCLFYCHYPDKFLAGSNPVKRLFYRRLFDYLEEITTGTPLVLA